MRRRALGGGPGGVGGRALERNCGTGISAGLGMRFWESLSRNAGGAGVVFTTDVCEASDRTSFCGGESAATGSSAEDEFSGLVGVGGGGVSSTGGSGSGGGGSAGTDPESAAGGGEASGGRPASRSPSRNSLSRRSRNGLSRPCWVASPATPSLDAASSLAARMLVLEMKRVAGLSGARSGWSSGLLTIPRFGALRGSGSADRTKEITSGKTSAAWARGA